MGGDPKDCAPQERATLQAMYAAALLDIFKLVHETASAGGAGAVARLKAYKRDAYAFAEYAGEYAQQMQADLAAAKAAGPLKCVESDHTYEPGEYGVCKRCGGEAPEENKQ